MSKIEDRLSARVLIVSKSKSWVYNIPSSAFLGHISAHRLSSSRDLPPIPEGPLRSLNIGPALLQLLYIPWGHIVTPSYLFVDVLKLTGLGIHVIIAEQERKGKGIDKDRGKSRTRKC
jgi:hypothetical protein